MKCHHCGKSTPYSAVAFCGQCGALLSSGSDTEPTTAHQQDLPAWETEKRNSAPFQTLFRTIIDAVFSSDGFYRKIAARSAPTFPALVFGLATGSIGMLALWFWSTLLSKYGLSTASLKWAIGELPLPFMLIVSPFFLIFQLLFTAVYLQIVMRFGRVKSIPFAQTFRMLCYAESSVVLQIIPIIGTFAASVMWLYAMLTGLHHLYAVGRLKALFLLFLPIIALAGFLLIVIIAGVLGGIIAGTGLLQGWQPFFQRFQ